MHNALALLIHLLHLRDDLLDLLATHALLWIAEGILVVNRSMVNATTDIAADDALGTSYQR